MFHVKNLESAKEFSDKCVDTAEKWAPVADKLWTAWHPEIVDENENIISMCHATVLVVKGQVRYIG